MDFILLNILFLAVYALLFGIFVIISKLIFNLLDMLAGWETPTIFIGLFAGVTSSLIMIAILRGMPV
ncbi:hypothetical protein [Bacillus toyonensis]|uniref:hypothetical protein n=1 Tax=Bacillus toyonensis TaxID=155322 RepID=UPI000B44C098|nr:hypothetical protein [Bacillus toyonensis]MED3201328.1 hypothetical protein [Bacillus toyonensis]OTX16469.1 hypothetical protein BK712_00085 [Bacillus thuringiensis serovar seoulensis]